MYNGRFSLAGGRLALLLLSALLSSCALTNKLLPGDSGQARAAALLQLQLNVMRFADEYTGRVTDSVAAFQHETTDRNERLAAQNWLVTQATAAYTIASGANPDLNALDMVVFATLSRMVIDDLSNTERYRVRSGKLRGTHELLEKRAWDAAGNLLTAAQSDELRSSLEKWREQNPNLRSVAYIHFNDFALEANKTTRSSGSLPGSVFSLLGLDPLSNLDPAVRELTQARQLAERALYYAQRTPNLIDMEVQRMAFELAVMPESVSLLEDINRTSIAAQQAGNLVASLPDLLAKERVAAIEQLMGALDARETRMRTLIAELRSTLEAGTVTSDSLKATITSFDALMARFDNPAGNTASPSRPFDITEYTETVRQLGDVVRQTEALLVRIDGDVPALTQLSQRTSDQVQSLVDHAFWRLVQLVLVIVAVTLIAALGFRLVVQRWSRPRA